MALKDAPQPSVEEVERYTFEEFSAKAREVGKTVFALVLEHIPAEANARKWIINKYLLDAVRLTYKQGNNVEEPIATECIDNIYINDSGVVEIHIKHRYHLDIRSPIHGTVDQFDLE